MAVKKNVPEIRFKGFSGVWVERLLSEIATMKARIGWQGLTQKEHLDNGDYYLITGTDFLNGSIDFKNCHYISEKRYIQDLNIQIKNNDVLITKDGTIGKVAYVQNMDKPSTLNAGVFVIKGRDLNTSNLYLYHYLAAPFLLDYAYKQATGGTIKHLNQNVLVKFPIPYTEVKEQSRIGTYFQNLDKLINLHQAKYNKLVNIKKAMLEKMFPKNGADVPEIRFKGFEGKWEEKQLGEIGKTYTGLSGKTKDDFGHGEGKYITYMNIFSNPVSSREITEPIEIDNCQNEVQFGDVFFTTSSETPEEVGMSSVWLENLKNVYLNSFCFGYRPSLKMDSYFLAYMLRSFSFRKKITFLAQGISRYNISKNKVMEITIPLPNINEQIKVGKYFQNLDKLISLHKKELEKLKNIKKACLEKMFV